VYRAIETQLWHDPRVRSISAHAKLLFLYCITCPNGNMGGIHYLPLSSASRETGLTTEELHAALHELVTAGLVKWDEPNEVVWVVRQLHYQAHNPNNYKSVAAVLESLRCSPLSKEFAKTYPEVMRVAPTKLRSSLCDEKQLQLFESMADADGADHKRKRDPLFEAVAEATGSDPAVSASHIGKVVKLLKGASPPYTPDEVNKWAEAVSQWMGTERPSLGFLQKDIGRIRNGTAVIQTETMEDRLRKTREKYG